jgi:hypothetical protein
VETTPKRDVMGFLLPVVNGPDRFLGMSRFTTGKVKGRHQILVI